MRRQPLRHQQHWLTTVPLPLPPPFFRGGRCHFRRHCYRRHCRRHCFPLPPPPLHFCQILKHQLYFLTMIYSCIVNHLHQQYWLTTILLPLLPQLSVASAASANTAAAAATATALHCHRTTTTTANAAANCFLLPPLLSAAAAATVLCCHHSWGR